MNTRKVSYITGPVKRVRAYISVASMYIDLKEGKCNAFH